MKLDALACTDMLFQGRVVPFEHEGDVFHAILNPVGPKDLPHLKALKGIAKSVQVQVIHANNHLGRIEQHTRHLPNHHRPAA